MAYFGVDFANACENGIWCRDFGADSLRRVWLLIVTRHLVEDLTADFCSRCWWHILAATFWGGGFFCIGRQFFGVVDFC